MTTSKLVKLAAVLLAMFALAPLALLSSPAHDGDEEDSPSPPKAGGQAGPSPKQTVAMPKGLVGLRVVLGQRDAEPTDWSGEVRVSEGRLMSLEVVRGGPGVRTDAEGRFTVAVPKAEPKKQGANKKKNAAKKQGANKKKNAAKKQAQGRPQPLVLLALVDGTATTAVRVSTPRGDAEVKLADLRPASATPILDGRGSIALEGPSVRLTASATEDDFPAVSSAREGSVWMAYVSYRPEVPRLEAPIHPEEFDKKLVPTTNGDRVLLRRFDGAAWHPAQVVADGRRDVWRPTLAVDGEGVVHVAWAEQIDGNWDIHRRRFDPRANSWSDAERISGNPGSDFHVVAVTDSRGGVWLAWQSWRAGNYEIVALPPGTREPRVVSNSPANDWSPAIAADAKGNVYVAWDSYANGNYDVFMTNVANGGPVTPVATSARFEARPSIACDTAGRVWVAHELGDEQWGKDYANEGPERVPVKQTGFALYIGRTIQVTCFVDGKPMAPVADVVDAFEAAHGPRKLSQPRLTAAPDGSLWLLARHHPLATGAGEAWVSSTTRFDGAAWSQPQELPHSTNLLDNRPAAAAVAGGLLVAHSTDTRTNTANRDQDDVFASLVLAPSQAVQPAALQAPRPPEAPRATPPHPNEPADKARIRAYRIEHGGQALRLLRGEFHRHTEYSAHRDQDGLLEDAWRYALDAGDLDWMGDGDHMNGANHEYMWWIIQKMADLHHHAPRFVSIHSYERSVVYPSGHRNVIMPKRGIRPLPVEANRFGTPEEGSPDIKNLYAYLKHFGAICSSHTSGTNMGTDWRDNDPEVEPVVEIYQGHRHNYEHLGAPRAATEATQIGGYQPAGTIWNALGKGYRLGFQSSSDHVSTHWSYAVVLSADATRAGLINAFKKRHCYAATDNIILDVRSGDHLMGDIFTTADRPTLKIVAQGTAPIVKLHVVRDATYALTIEPNAQSVSLTYTDEDAKPGDTHYYYVRVEQADTNLAWASPMWIEWRP